MVIPPGVDPVIGSDLVRPRLVVSHVLKVPRSAADGQREASLPMDPSADTELMFVRNEAGELVPWQSLARAADPVDVPAAAGQGGAGGPAVAVDPAVVARQAAAELRLPGQEVELGPDPRLNEWNMAAVGYPIWLWRDGPDTVTESVSLAGVTLTMTASYVATTFEMGDGNTVRCAESTVWVRGAQEPGTASPTCGYRYGQPSGEGGYTITATHDWQLTWTGLGQTGSFPLSSSASRTVEVGELASIIVSR